jgi:spore coat polysaccharide biosynthesis protein SpsF (cytidylyltransferase family)
MKKLDTKTIAIIPARRGSVGLPNKNLRKLGDKNLIQLTVDSDPLLAFDVYPIKASTSLE